MQLCSVFLFLSVMLASGSASNTDPVLEQSVERSPVGKKYNASWESLDSRPLPSWYDQAKVGIFIHWGVFSVPAFGTGTEPSDGAEWFWVNWQYRKRSAYVNFMANNYRPGFTYADFAPKFTAELWDPDHWAELFHKSGAKYVVLTSKHHEGYTLWPSRYAFSWNSMDVGPRRDIVGELAAAIRKYDNLHFGLYHSLFEWFNPLYLSDRHHNTTDFVSMKTMPELYELVNLYHPDIIWSDGEWNDPPEYWNSTEFLAWLYNDSPVKNSVVVNDRWGKGTRCQHGGFYNCDDRFSPGVLQKHKWENAFTLDTGSWGLRRNARLSDYMSPEDMIAQLVRTVSCGGNVLINIGPGSDGTILPVYEERLTQLGEWLDINGEAIYQSSHWAVQNDSVTPDVWYTARFELVYATVLHWPESGSVKLGSAPDQIICEMVGYGPVSCLEGEVVFPPLEKVSSKWAWVIKLIPA